VKCGYSKFTGLRIGWARVSSTATTLKVFQPRPEFIVLLFSIIPRPFPLLSPSSFQTLLSSTLSSFVHTLPFCSFQPFFVLWFSRASIILNMALNLAASQHQLIGDMIRSRKIKQKPIAAAACCSVRGTQRIAANIRCYNDTKAPSNGVGQ
jgi:hypothetical protein